MPFLVWEEKGAEKDCVELNLDSRMQINLEIYIS